MSLLDEMRQDAKGAVRGRWFNGADTSESQPVAVINETLARTYWKDPNAAVGGRIRLGNPRNPWAVVVGMVADERHNGITGIVKEKFYIPHAQWHVAAGGGLDPQRFRRRAHGRRSPRGGRLGARRDPAVGSESTGGEHPSDERD